MLNFNLYKKTFGLLLTLCISTAASAKLSDNTTYDKESTCPASYKHVNKLNLCVSKTFSYKPYSPFISNGVDKKCKSGHARIPGMTFCLSNRRTVHLNRIGRLFVVSNVEKKGCKPSYRRAGKSRFCIDRRLALVSDGESLRLENMANVDCVETDFASSQVCKSVCKVGFLRSLAKGLCVEWQLARNGHEDLEMFGHNCKKSKYWTKYSDNGLCLPKYDIEAIIQGDSQAIVQQSVSGNRCDKGGEPQVITIALVNEPVKTDTNATHPRGQSAAGGFTMAPVVMCAARQSGL